MLHIKPIFSTFAILLLASCAFAKPDPLQDESKTELGISSTQINPNTERLEVSIIRTDDLVQDDGSLLAHRIKKVVFNFNLRDGNSCDMNGQPINLDLDSVQVVKFQADLINPAQDKQQQLDTINQGFDKGLVTAEVGVTVSSANPLHGITFRRITINVKVTEVDGQAVHHSEKTERILEIKIHPNGSIEKLPTGSISKDGFISPHILPVPMQIGDHEASPNPSIHHSLFKPHGISMRKILTVAAGVGSAAILIVLLVEFFAGFLGSKRNYQPIKLDEPQDFDNTLPPEYSEKDSLMKEIQEIQVEVEK